MLSPLTEYIYFLYRLNEEQDEPSSPTLASVPLIHNIPELKVSQQVIHFSLNPVLLLLHALELLEPINR